MENKEKMFDINRLWTTKVFGIPIIYMLLIYAVLGFTQLYLFCPEDDFMCLQGVGSVIKDNIQVLIGLIIIAIAVYNYFKYIKK